MPNIERKTLILIRHAKSDWHTAATSDYQRPLNSRGEKDAIRMAGCLSTLPFAIDILISSPACRAKQTAEKISSACGLNTKLHWQKKLYLASAAEIERIVEQALTDHNTIALVGHNPGMEDLLLQYCPDAPLTNNGKLLTTANIAIISFPLTTLSPTFNLNQAAQLIALLRPQDQ